MKNGILQQFYVNILISQLLINSHALICRLMNLTY